MSRANKKHLDFELNLIPFIDLLSVCICFLLMTAVWIQVGSMDTKQAIGGQSAAETEKKPTLWASLLDNGSVDLEVKDSRIPKNQARARIEPTSEGQPNWDRVEALVGQWRGVDPLVATALIQPKAGSALEQIIELMDRFRKTGVVNLGVSPL